MRGARDTSSNEEPQSSSHPQPSTSCSVLSSPSHPQPSSSQSPVMPQGGPSAMTDGAVSPLTPTAVTENQ